MPPDWGGELPLLLDSYKTWKWSLIKKIPGEQKNYRFGTKFVFLQSKHLKFIIYIGNEQKNHGFGAK